MNYMKCVWKESSILKSCFESTNFVCFLRPPRMEQLHLWCITYTYVFYVEINDQHCKASFVLRTIRRQQAMLNNAKQSNACAYANLAAQRKPKAIVRTRKSHSWGIWSAKCLGFYPSTDRAQQIKESSCLRDIQGESKKRNAAQQQSEKVQDCMFDVLTIYITMNTQSKFYITFKSQISNTDRFVHLQVPSWKIWSGRVELHSYFTLQYLHTDWR